MARVTVEDCLEHVANRFELVLLASKRARQLTRGVTPLLDWDKDKPTVVALREIAAGILSEETVAQAQPQEPSIEDQFKEAVAAEIQSNDDDPL